MLGLDEMSPDFGELKGADGGVYSLASFKDKPVLVVMFTCNRRKMSGAY